MNVWLKAVVTLIAAIFILSSQMYVLETSHTNKFIHIINTALWIGVIYFIGGM